MVTSFLHHGDIGGVLIMGGVFWGRGVWKCDLVDACFSRSKSSGTVAG